MNNERFIELLNLYIDGELPKRDIPELEEEILTNPDRRQTYSEYCRVHTATRAYFERFRISADANTAGPIRALREAVGAPAPAHVPAVAGFPMAWLKWGTGLAAAGMLGIVGLRLLEVKNPAAPEQPAPEASVMAVVVESDAEPEQEIFVAPLSVAATQPEATPVNPLAEPATDPFALPEGEAKTVIAVRDPFSLGPMVAEELSRDASREGGMFLKEFDAGIQRPHSFELQQIDFSQESPEGETRVFRSQGSGDKFEMAPVGHRILR